MPVALNVAGAAFALCGGVKASRLTTKPDTAEAAIEVSSLNILVNHCGGQGKRIGNGCQNRSTKESLL